MRHLLIGGTGAVGAVYAAALRQAGEDVLFYVRPAYKERLVKHGLVLHNLTTLWMRVILMALVSGAFVGVVVCRMLLGWGWPGSVLIGIVAVVQLYAWLRRIPGAGRPRWVYRSHGDCRADQVVCSAEEIRALKQPPEVVWICVNSAQLRGDWLPKVLAAAGPAATILSMTPGLEDYGFIQQAYPCAERYAAGTIGFISYQAPLAWERHHPTIALDTEMEEAIRIAVFQPIMSPSRFCGAPEVIQPLVAALNRGGCPASYAGGADKARKGFVHTPFLINFWPALEAAGWRFDRLQDPGEECLDLYLGMVREQFRSMQKRHGKAPMAWLCGHPYIFRILLRVAPQVMPFDFEVYLHYHFSKVGAQTLLQLQSLIQRLREDGLPSDNTREVLQRIELIREHRVQPPWVGRA